MQRIFSIFATALLCIGTVSAVSPQKLFFHCDKDTLKINELLQRGADSGITTPGKLAAAYGQWLLDTPYVAHTLEHDGDEVLTINIDELDCMTFVETVYALVRTTLNGRYSWRDFANNLEDIRYRNGELIDYASRLHYASNWIIDNIHRGNLTEATRDIEGRKNVTKTLNYMSTHPDSYSALADTTQLRKIREVEIGYRNHLIPYISKDAVHTKKVAAQLRDGDIVGLVTKADGLDISHFGIILKDGNNVMFLNASSVGKKVRIEKNIADYLRSNRSVLGLRVVRIKP